MTDDREVLRSSIEQVLARICDSRTLHQIVDGEGGDGRDVLKKAGELGWLAIGVSEEGGGLGLGIDGAALLARELGRRVAPGPFIPVLSCLQALDEFAPHDVRGRALSDLMSGDVPAAIPASLEAGDAANMQFGEIRGRDTYILVPCEEGFALAFPTGAGISACQNSGWDRTRAFWSLPSAHQIVWKLPVQARRHLEICFHLLVAADTLGAIEGIFARTVEFLKERVQFGVPLGSFQALKHRMADMAAQIELMDCLLAQALEAASGCEADAEFWSGACKADVTDVAAILAQECLQLHGAIGFTWEYDCHLYLKRVRLNQALARPNNVLRERCFGQLAVASKEARSLLEIAG